MSLHFCNDLAHTYPVLRGKKIQIYKKILTIDFSYMENATCGLKLHGRGVKGKYMYVLFTWREVRKVTNCLRGLEYNPRAKAHFFFHKNQRALLDHCLIFSLTGFCFLLTEIYSTHYY